MFVKTLIKRESLLNLKVSHKYVLKDKPILVETWIRSRSRDRKNKLQAQQKWNDNNNSQSASEIVSKGNQSNESQRNNQEQKINVI